MVPGNRHASFLALLILFALTACSTSKPPPLAELDSLAAAPGVAFLPPLGSAVATGDFDPEVNLSIAVFRLNNGVPSGSPVAHFTIGDGSIRAHERQGHYRATWRIKQARLPNGTKVRIEARFDQTAPEGPACTTTQVDPSKGCLAFVDVQLWQNMGRAKKGGKGNDVIHLNRNRTLPIKVYVAKGAAELPDPDEDANVTLLVSAADGSSTTAGNYSSRYPSISANGRYVAFTSSATNLVPGVSDLYSSRIYRRDIQTNSTILVSAADGSTTEGNSHSEEPTISANGRYVAFTSSATNLVPGVSGHQLYLRDIQTNSTILVSAADGSMTPGNHSTGSPSISADGRYVAFASMATNLVPEVSDLGSSRIYLRDTQTNSTILVSAADGGTTPAHFDFDSRSPSISADGRYVAFHSTARNLVPGVNIDGMHRQVYLRDTQTNSTILVSAADGSTTEGNGDSGEGGPSISADGRYVAFAHSATNLVPGVSGLQVYLRDTQTNSTILVSAADGGTTAGDGMSYRTSTSADGRYVAFQSDHATNLVPGVSGVQIYLRDTQTNRTILMSAADGSTTAGNGWSESPSISADGRSVAFHSEAGNLPGVGGHDADSQVYLRIR